MATITDGQGMHIARVAKKRRGFLTQHFPCAEALVLEFGALDNPTFLKNEGEIYYADYFTQAESQARHQNRDRIVSVDFILRDKTLQEAVKVRPDLVIANHVLEHIADPIGWFQDLRAICHDASFLALALPDRRFTFDFFKPVTDAVDWLRCHEECLERPSKWQILRHLYYHSVVSHQEIWEGQLPTTHKKRINLADALAKADTLAHTYSDVHCSVFTFESFSKLMEDLSETDLVRWKIAASSDVQSGENEFLVLLRAI